MKRFLLLFIIIISFSSTGVAQDSAVVRWSAVAVKTADKSFEIKFTGQIRKGWHIYAAPDAILELSGVTVSKDTALFSLGTLKLQSIPGNINDPVFAKSLAIIRDSISFIQPINFSGDVPAQLNMAVNYEVADAQSFFPESQSVPVRFIAGAVSAESNRILIPTIDLKKPLSDCGTSSTVSQDDTKSKSLWAVFLLGFAGGLVSLLLPCLFPMIPLTVSFFTNKAKSRKRGIFNAFLYGFFIFAIYVLITVPFHLFEKLNPAIFNNVSTNVYLNVAFFIIFVFFAFSFFGFYEITLPSRLSNNVDSKANSGTVWGIFFMALTLTIVSFSCTGPVAGSLLAGVVDGKGGAMRLTFGMAGFGLAIGLPFALFALFPNLLKSLPKSGGWLHTVKVVLGFLELAFALKFLSNADLVMHWNLLKREIFIGIWIVIGLFTSLYLWNLIRFKYDDPKQRLSIFRIVCAIIFSTFTLYLVPGVTNTKYNNLTLISGFPPPLYYSIYHTANDCVLNLNCSHDYEEGLKLAREQNKPLLIDFTGYACVNCRRMEEKVWSRPDVYAMMKENFIVVSLYVDDKKSLPASQRFTYRSPDGNVLEIKTVGDKWSAFETENFKNNAQPLYAILNTNEQLLTHPAAYTPSADEYLEWLKCGLETFQRK